MEKLYPIYTLSNGIRVKFMCMNKEGFELYKNLQNGLINIVREDSGLWSYTDGRQWGIRKIPMMGIRIIK